MKFFLGCLLYGFVVTMCVGAFTLPWLLLLIAAALLVVSHD